MGAGPRSLRPGGTRVPLDALRTQHYEHLAVLSSAAVAGLELEPFLLRWAAASPATWLDGIERLASNERLDPWSSEETNVLVARWLASDERSAALAQALSALPEHERRWRQGLIDQLRARVHGRL